MNTATLGDKPVYDPPTNSGIFGTNFFEMHTGAARFGYGEFLMRLEDYNAIASNETAVLKMMSVTDSGSDGPPGLTLTVVLAGARPATTGTDGGQFVKVVVHDRRCKMQEPKRKGFNVQKQGFSMSGTTLAKDDCYDGTLNSGALWTWPDVVSAIEIAGSPTLPTPLPAFKPRNLIFDNVPHNRMIDDVMARLFVVVGYDHQMNQFTLSKPGVLGDTNTGLQGSAENYLIGGKEGVRNKKRIPGEIDVTFMAYQEDSDDLYSNRIYQKVYTNPDGGSGKEALHVGEYIALYRSGSVVNGTELDTCASDLAVRYVLFASQVPGEQEYAGIWPFVPDGKIRAIRWISGPSDGPESWRGARTQVQYNNDRDLNPMIDMRRLVDARSNAMIVGLGGTMVGLGTGGTRMLSTQGEKFRVVAKITDKETRGGCYKVKLVTDQTGFDPTTADSSLSIAPTLGDDELVFENADENDLHTHWLVVGSYVVGEIVGKAVSDVEEDPDNRKLMLGIGITYDTTAGVTMNPTGGTADTATWDRTNKDHKALSFTVISRPWFDDSDGTDYYFTRELRIDAGGRVSYASAETKVNKTTGEPCDDGGE